MVTRLMAVERQTRNISQDFVRVTEEFQNMQMRYSEFDNTITKLNDGHDHFIKELTEQHSKIDAVTSRLDTGSNELEARFNKLDALLFDLDNRTTRMEETLSKLGVKLPTLATGGLGPRDKLFQTQAPAEFLPKVPFHGTLDFMGM